MLGALSHAIWKLECRLNRRLWVNAANPDAITHEPVGISTDVRCAGAPEAAPRAAAPRSNGERVSLAVVITTHARVEPCRRLLEQVYASLESARLLEESFVVVLRDTSVHDYAEVEQWLARQLHRRFAMYESSSHLGKRNRYLAFQTAFDVVRELAPDHVLFLEDDVELETNFIESSIELFESIDDSSKSVLYLCKFDDDETNGRWVHFPRRAGPLVSQTQWFDLHAFIAAPRFFEALRWRVFRPFPSRFRYRPNWSSGVSEQFTRRLQGRGHIYQVNTTLVRHGKEPSLLNVEARASRALNNFGPSG
jgi:hypothetical protein